MKVTQWFTSDIKPKHKGVYERSHPFMPGLMPYSYWNGKHWGFSRSTPYVANMDKAKRSAYQDCKWRGIAR